MTIVFEWIHLIFFSAGVSIGAILVAIILWQVYRSRLSIRSVELQHLRQQLNEASTQLADRTNALTQSCSEVSALKERLNVERGHFQEQLGLLSDARQNLTREFENLANRIFEAKQESFTRHSKTTLSSAIDPLRKELTDFRKKVEDVYDKENAERNRLAGQIVELQKQAQRIGEDAVNLTNALKGDSKMQGNWGEIVLERILEESGLRKDHEYRVQPGFNDAEGRRRNPDIVVHLPEQRDIVIDAKVSLLDFERYCSETDDEIRSRHLRAHINSLRNHVNGLNRKAYEQLEGVRTLDFVLIFVPVETAFMAALENDQTLFRDAYDKGIILVSPTTLLATLKTIHNIWRFESQNRNAEKIAAQAGGLYDQFVLVIDSLEELGRQLDKSQQLWQQTRKRLIAGRGNLVKRLEDIRQLGARTKKHLDVRLVEEAEDQELLPKRGEPESLEYGRDREEDSRG